MSEQGALTVLRRGGTWGWGGDQTGGTGGEKDGGCTCPGKRCQGSGGGRVWGFVGVHSGGSQQDLLVDQMQGTREREISCPKQLAGGTFMEMEKTKGGMSLGERWTLFSDVEI